MLHQKELFLDEFQFMKFVINYKDDFIEKISDIMYDLNTKSIDDFLKFKKLQKSEKGHYYLHLVSLKNFFTYDYESEKLIMTIHYFDFSKEELLKEKDIDKKGRFSVVYDTDLISEQKIDYVFNYYTRKYKIKKVREI